MPQKKNKKHQGIKALDLKIKTLENNLAGKKCKQRDIVCVLVKKSFVKHCTHLQPQVQKTSDK